MLRLFQYLPEPAENFEDLDVAERALAAVETADVNFPRTPFIYRKADWANGLRRELVVPLGASAYVLLYEIVGPCKVFVLAVSHQMEQDSPLRGSGASSGRLRFRWSRPDGPRSRRAPTLS